jgi:RNA polymerase sigma-70 factor (ECF subfamily)
MDYLTASQNNVLVRRSKLDHRDVYAQSTDKQLVELTLAGDETAFECIFDRHKRRIAAIAGRYFHKRADVDEIIQTSFAKAYFELASFRGLNEFSLASWLGRITINTCLSALLRNAKKLEDLSDELSEDHHEIRAADLRGTNAEELVIQRDLVEKLLACLRVEDRVLLQMLYAQDLPIADVAVVFGWSQTKVKVRAFRAKRSLRRIVRKFL